METLIDILHFLVQNRFAFLIISLLLLLAFRALVLLFINSKKKKIIVNLVSALLIWGVLFVFFFGSNFTNKQIYKYGELGEGVIIERNATDDLYNEEPILQYKLLIKTKTGETLETSFKSHDFNLYPDSAGVFDYPANGVAFNVRYLNKKPSAFIIITDDNSKYAKQLQCAEKLKMLNKAKSKHDFEPANPDYKKEYEKAIDSYLKSECIKNSSIKDYYIQEKSKLR
ncbi:hypothetical protein [Flagellimonas sp.]|uniref:hypothetical protein n=1 Tax=Flagellimonas sp. TaxID=2058762 RepID=UPI003F4A1DE7